jgi:hypothetical protein
MAGIDLHIVLCPFEITLEKDEDPPPDRYFPAFFDPQEALDSAVKWGEENGVDVKIATLTMQNRLAPVVDGD